MEQLHIILAVDHYNTLGLVRSLGENGINPIFISIKGRTKVTSLSKYVGKYYDTATVEEGYKVLIKEYGDIYKDGLKPYIYCIDDKTVNYMDERYDELKDRFIFFNAGQKGRITEYMDKYNILEIAKKHGLKVLDSVRCKKGEIPKGIEYPIITKSISPVKGGWKSDVHICNSEDELVAAYDKIASDEVVIQKYIEKKNEYCLDGFCANKGKIMFNAIESTYNYLLDGFYSPYMTVKGVKHPELTGPLQSMMEEIGFEGIYSIEFLIDQNDNYYFLEVNFRNSTWSYAATVAGMPLPYLWYQAMETKEVKADWLKPVDEDGFMAMVEPIDYAKRVDTGMIEAGEWLKDFKEAKCGYYYGNSNDPEPFYEVVRNWKQMG